MKKELSSFNVYHSYLQALEPLSDAECGRLLKACLQYSMTGEAPELRGNEKFLFPSWKSQIDRDREKYEARCRKNKENISVRWYTNEYDGIRTYTKRTKDKEKDKDNNTPHKSPQGDDDGFSEFWAAYPNKRCGKANALKAWRKIKHTPELDADIMSGLERQKAWPQWEKDGGQYVPMATTWLNQRRWDAEGGSGDDYWR